MVWMLKSILKAVVLPPGSFIILFIIATIFYALAKKWIARIFSSTFILGLYFLSTPFVSGSLVRYLEADLPVFMQDAKAQAIVILGGGQIKNAIEYDDEDVVNSSTLTRLVYGAFLYKKTSLPILTSGGMVESDDRIPEAKVMANELNKNFSIKVKWTEEKSQNTTENALFTEEILAKAGVKRILLVTEAWHMRRALIAFSATNLKVTPAPTGFESRSISTEILQWLPRAWALQKSSLALHEFLGIVWAKITP